MVHVSGTPGASDAVQSLLQEGGLQPGDASVHIIDGEPGHAISALSDKIGADVIVLGPHRKQPKGERGGPFGSTAMEAVTSASAPCLVLAQPLRLPLRCVVVGVDLSDTSRGAVVIGLAWASALRAQARAPTPATKLIALYIQPEESDGSPAPRALDEELKQMKRAAGEWAIVAIEGATATNASAAVGIIEYANAHDADLVVVGTRGTGLNEERRLGRVTSTVTQKSQLPTLLVPPTVWTAYAGEPAQSSSSA